VRTVDLYDTITLSASKKVEPSLIGDQAARRQPPNHQPRVCRALPGRAAARRRACGRAHRQRIPVQRAWAAAAAMPQPCAAVTLWRCGQDEANLIEIAAGSADPPFFVAGGTAASAAAADRAPATRTRMRRRSCWRRRRAVARTAAMFAPPPLR
jgi:4-diphosphocytidyl-2C-methyl-D-erythritol kinase